MKTLDEHKEQLIEGVVKSELPADVKIICLDILYERATIKTIERARQTTKEQYNLYNIVRLVAGTNPKYANHIFWESLPLIEEAIYGHFISDSEDFDRWRESAANPV